MVYRIGRDEEMTLTLLGEYIAEHKVDTARRGRKLQDAYENKYPIFFEERKPAGKPDNRIAVNYAKYITDTFNGFFCGIPVKVSSDEEAVNDYILALDARSNGANVNAEISKFADIEGRAYEMYYRDEDGEAAMTYLTDLEAFMICDDSILERPRFFVRYYTDADGVEHGSISDDRTVRWFYREPGTYRWDGEEIPHGFKYVPAVEYISNDERMGIFESALPAINAYNKALSEKANDVDYFSEAYMKIIGAKVNESDLPFMRQTRVINIEDTNDNDVTVDFMAKPSADETQEHLLDRLKDDIFLTSMVANISDENFGTASGIALRYRMQAMSNLFTVKARRFTAAMYDRYKILMSSADLPSGISPDSWQTIRIKFTPNYPANLENEAEVAAKLEGIVSKETQLGVLSNVDNVQTEIERIEAETQPLIDTAIANALGE